MNSLLLPLLLLMGPPPQPIPSEPHAWITHTAIAAAGIGQVTDLSTSMYAMGSGRFREVNPLLSWAEDKPVAMGLVKGLVAAGTTYGLLKLHQRKPKTALVAAIGLTILQGWVTWRNAEALR